MAKTFTVTRPLLQPVHMAGSYLFDVHEQAAQTFLEGAILMWDQANSGVKEMVNNASVDLAGIAEEPGHNAAGQMVRVAALRAHEIIEINLAVAGANTRVLAATDMGILGGFVKRTIGTLHWVFDPAQVQKHGRCLRPAHGTNGSPDGFAGAIGDTNARVLVAILGTTATASLQIGW